MTPHSNQMCMPRKGHVLHPWPTSLTNAGDFYTYSICCTLGWLSDLLFLRYVPALCGFLECWVLSLKAAYTFLFYTRLLSSLGAGNGYSLSCTSHELCTNNKSKWFSFFFFAFDLFFLLLFLSFSQTGPPLGSPGWPWIYYVAQIGL